MQHNEYLLAKIGVDTAENEPCKVCPLSAYRSPRCEHYLEEKPELLRKAGLLPHYDTSPWIDDFLPKTRTEALSLIHGASERENIIRGKEHAQYLLAADAKKNVRKASGTSDELASKLTK